MLTNALLWVALLLLLLAPTHHVTDAQQSTHYTHTESSTMGSSLVVNQLAILRMLEESSNSCSAVPPNFLERLQVQLEQDKNDFHTTIADFLMQMVALKNDSLADVQRMSEVKAAINDTKQDVVTVEENIVEIQTRLDDTQTRLDDTWTRLDDTQTRLDDTRIHLDDTKTRLDDTQTCLNDTQSRLNDTQTHLNVTQTRLDDTQTRLSDTQEEVSVMASAVQTTQADLRSSQATLQQLQDGHDEIKEELRHLPRVYQEVNNSRHSINTLDTRLSTLEDKVQQTSQDLADVSSRDFLSQCSGIKELRRLRGALTVVASGQYSDNMDCGWEVLMPPGSMILLTWSYLNTEAHDDCAYDYVQLEDRVHPDQLLYGKKLCGSALPEALLVNGHHLKITFHSDGSNYYRGFLLRYFTFQED